MKRLFILLFPMLLQAQSGNVMNLFPDNAVLNYAPGSVLNIFGNYYNYNPYALAYIDTIVNNGYDLDVTYKHKINDLFNDLESINDIQDNFFRPDSLAISALKALYLFTGTTQLTQKWNAIDVRDADTAHRLEFVDSPTMADKELTLNGTSQYANTNYNVSEDSSISCGVYLKNDYWDATGYQTILGASSADNSQRNMIYLYPTTKKKIVVERFNLTGGQYERTMSATNKFIGNSFVLDTMETYIRKSNILNPVTDNGISPNLNLYLGAQNKPTGTGVFLKNTIEFAFLGDYMYDAAIKTLRQSLIKYITPLEPPYTGLGTLYDTTQIVNDANVIIAYSPFTICEERHGYALGYDEYHTMIYLSDDGGLTFDYANYIPVKADQITFSYVFDNGNVLFASRDRLYASYDLLTTIEEVEVLDIDGSRFDGSEYTGYSYMQANTDRDVYIEGTELLVWGNYGNVYGTNETNVYYTKNKGRTVKVCYKFGDGYNGLGDPTNDVDTRHVHGINYDSINNQFIMYTGDNPSAYTNVLSGTYNISTDVWDWNLIASGYPEYHWASVMCDHDTIYAAIEGATTEPYDGSIVKFSYANLTHPENWDTTYNNSNLPLSTGYMIDGGGGMVALLNMLVTQMTIIYSTDYGDTWNSSDISALIGGQDYAGKLNYKNEDGYYRLSLRDIIINKVTERRYGFGTVWIKIK